MYFYEFFFKHQTVLGKLFQWHAVICYLSQSIAVRQGGWVSEYCMHCDDSSRLSDFQLKDSFFFPLWEQNEMLLHDFISRHLQCWQVII